MSSTSQTLMIFNYKSNDFMHIPFRSTDTCEDVCILCCKALGILPPTRLLFGLRVQGTEKWKILSLKLNVSSKYEFRMRFKVPDFNSLHKIDAEAYNYLYYQIRYDLVSDRISDIRYPAYKDNVVGLGAVDMYIDLLENKASAESIESSYKHYLPKQLVKSHWIFAKKSICETFQRIRKNNRELSYVKKRYMHTIMELSPNYQMEIYNAIAEKLPDEDENNGPYSVTVKLDPFDADGPTIKVSQKMKKDWVVVTKLENIYALYREGKRVVHLDISGMPRGYRLEFSKPFEVKSFMTYIAGYFRLMTKWMFDPCVQYETPSLQELKALRCHGPVGGDFSYAKIRDKEGKCGSYILRQCEQEYDIYYIDINTRGTQTETFKITRDRDKWELHINDDVCSFNKLTDLALGIPTTSEKKFRIPPSEYDKPPLLLICLPRNLLPKKTVSVVNEAQLQRKRAQIFDPKEDLQWYKNSQKDCDDDKMVSLRADWVQSNNVKDVRVTLKHLKYDEDFQDFMKLTNTWNTIYSPEFIKIYGITLTTPYTMVMENAKYGQLNDFLFTHGEKIPLECLLDVVHGLVRGIAYLQEKGLIHGFIRCSNLLVTKFDLKSQLLIAKISDYGLPRPYKLQDLPWIPFDYHKDLEAAKTDPQAELWAFATTFWEIFARGKPITNVSAETLSQNYYRYGCILRIPALCPEELHPVMMDGWSMDPDKRFNQQAILKLLNISKQSLHPNYTSIAKTDSVSDDEGSILSNFSNATDDTFQTLLNGNSSGDMGSCTASGNSFTCDRAPLIRHNGIRKHHTNYFDDIPSVLMIPNGKIIYKEKIGEGHYGTVYRGEIQYHNNYVPVPVAIKTLKLSKSNRRFSEDFMREIKIMQELNHPNIIKIKMSVESPVSIIMEYVESRSFIVYLSSQKPNLTNDTLLCFALDIAKGMEYLRSKKVIHRDLAARNILVDGSTVKISDFGLAQIANNDGYYFAQSEREIPIKWYAPESIKTTKFSFQSDVWSYGVTLFEMFSRGEIPNLDPHKELSPVDFYNRLESGQRLRQPELCPESVYDKVMIPCWHENPKMRPVFKDIVDIIQSIKNESGECI